MTTKTRKRYKSLHQYEKTDAMKTNIDPETNRTEAYHAELILTPDELLKRSKPGQPVAMPRQQYMDLSQGPQNYEELVNQVAEINEQFQKLPAKIRDRFGNDPQQLLDFVHDPANIEEAVKIGLVDAPEPPVKAPTPADHVADVSTPDSPVDSPAEESNS